MPSDQDDSSPLTAGRFTDPVAARRDVKIRQAALQCFGENGCFRTDLEQVARLVGVGKGTLYRHYGSKQLLLKATLETGMALLRARCERIVRSQPDNPRLAFELVVRELVTLNLSGDACAPAALSRLLCGCRWSGAGLTPATLTAGFAECIRRCQNAGGFRADADAEWIATAVLALINAADVPAATAGGKQPPEQAIVDERVSRVLGLVAPLFA